MIIPLGTGRSESFLVKEKKTLLVDTGAFLTTKKFVQLLADNDLRPEDLSLIIITHGHIDHFALLPELKNLTPAPVVCHELAKPCLISGVSIPAVVHSKFASFILKTLGMKEPPYPKGVSPEMTVLDELELKPFGVNGRIVSTPGHTDCSLSVITDKGEAVIGDFLLERPFSAKPHFTFVAIDVSQMKKSLEMVYDLGCHTFYSAHAAVYNKEQLEKLLNKT